MLVWLASRAWRECVTAKDGMGYVSATRRLNAGREERRELERASDMLEWETAVLGDGEDVLTFGEWPPD